MTAESGYSYESEKTDLFTEHGVEKLMEINSVVRNQLFVSGAFTVETLMTHATGDSFQILACIEQLVYATDVTQKRVYIGGDKQ